MINDHNYKINVIPLMYIVRIHLIFLKPKGWTDKILGISVKTVRLQEICESWLGRVHTIL